MELKNWYLRKQDDERYQAVGNAYGHPRFEEGKYVYTSDVVRVNSENGKLYADTASGSHYELIFGKADMENYENTMNVLKELDVPEEIIGEFESLGKDFFEEQVKYMEILLEDGELLLMLRENNGLQLMHAYYKENGSVSEQQSRKHKGRDEESTIIGEKGGLFRYFNKYELECYYWSEKIKAVKIWCKNREVFFTSMDSSQKDDKEGLIWCAEDMVTTISRALYTGEEAVPENLKKTGEEYEAAKKHYEMKQEERGWQFEISSVFMVGSWDEK